LGTFEPNIKWVEMETKKTALAFVRVSKDQQNNQRQKNEITAYAEKNDIKISEWVELSISGSKAKSYVDNIFKKAKKNDFVIFQEVSRMGRNMASISMLIEKLHESKICVVVTSQNIKTIKKGKIDASQKLVLNMLISVAVHESDNLSVRIKSGIKAREKKGLPIGRPVGSSENDLLLKPKNKKIVDRLIRGMSIREICFLLTTSISQVQRIKKLAIAEGIIKK